MTSTERANTGLDVIKLTAAEALAFETSLRKRSAIAEAGEAMARNFAQQIQEAITEINAAYIGVAQTYDLNLETHRYEYDPANKTLVLTQIALKGKV